jgi:hypothetical protein
LLKDITDPKELRPVLLSVLSTSGTLAGLSLALVGLVNLKISHTQIGSLADDMFLMGAMGFVTVSCFTFFALRHINSPKVKTWTKIIDTGFICSLVTLVLAGIVTVYELM